jgi:hypothetical protein
LAERNEPASTPDTSTNFWQNSTSLSEPKRLKSVRNGSYSAEFKRICAEVTKRKYMQIEFDTVQRKTENIEMLGGEETYTGVLAKLAEAFLQLINCPHHRGYRYSGQDHERLHRSLQTPTLETRLSLTGIWSSRGRTKNTPQQPRDLGIASHFPRRHMQMLCIQ